MYEVKTSWSLFGYVDQHEILQVCVTWYGEIYWSLFQLFFSIIAII